MTLQDLTESAIRNFAGTTIFQRGEGYYRNGMVENLQYDADSESIQAEVAGNYGEYGVMVTTGGGHLSASCNCPYDGYPCKHVVAVLLTFLHNPSMYKKQAAHKKHLENSLTKKIKALSKEELLDIVLSGVKKYPEMKRDLMVRLESNKKATFNTILHQIKRAFPSIESRTYSTSSIARELRRILKSVDAAPLAMQLNVYWAVTDRVLEELNDYGMDDDALEGVAIEAMENLVDGFRGNEDMQGQRAEVIEQLMDYYIMGNCGLVDWMYDTVMGLCAGEPDYKLVIEKLEQKTKKATYTSYYQNLIADLYEKLGDSQAQLKILESKLEYGMDYWRLAQYWFAHGNDEKAWHVVQEGLKKGQGRKKELYDALQQHYQKQNKYDRINDLLKQKIERKDLDDHWNVRQDSTYQWLWKHYDQQGDYDGKKALLELCLNDRSLDLKFYKEAEAALSPEDWQQFEPKIIETLKGRLKKEGPRIGYGFPAVGTGASAVDTLAEIYDDKNEPSQLFETVRGNLRLMKQYEPRLLAGYFDLYLQEYQKAITNLIKARGRDNYKAAASYAKTIKHIYTDIANMPEEWQKYITNLRSQHTRLRALKEELAHL